MNLLFVAGSLPVLSPVVITPAGGVCVGASWLACVLRNTNIGGVIKKNEQGEDIEYAAVLLEYISGAKSAELYDKLKKKTVLVNE